MFRLLTGLLFGSLISFAAYKKKYLSLSGFAAAVVFGTVLYFAGNIFFWIILISFFLSSSLLTGYREDDKSPLEEINEKGGERDHMQVIANGGLGLLFALLYYLTKTPVFIFAYAASFASANADTWASEIGVLSKGEPISILTLKRTQRGNSGAVSILGITASISGAVFIGFFFFTGYVLSFGWENELLTHTIVITAAGFLGSIIDSFLGALLQAKYRCVVCGKVTEKKIHHERDTEHISGIRFINNDMVNLLSCLSASVITILVLWK